jgi:WD40 repeat protein
MSKSATLRLIDGDLDQGIRVVLTIVTSHSSEETTSHEVSGALPPNIGLANTLKQWRSNYRGLAGTRIQGNQIIYDASIHQCRQNCQKLDKELRSHLNTWLLSDSFRSIRDKWLEQLMQDEVRVIIRTSSHSLLKLPWQLWDLIERNPLAEIALGTPDAEPTPNSNIPTLRGHVRVLAILGNSEGIDIESDRELLDSITDAEVKFLPEPKLKDINDQLWEQDWDILFFAGHSGTKDAEGRIKINGTESLTIPELRFALRNAVGRGLKLAIFNSCDGMELAFELQQLNLPQVIVMREPVPDEIAQEFLRYFLPAYVSGKSLYLAEREARLRLHGREDKFPGASWLPVIFQSPAATPPAWLDLGRRPTTLCPYRGLFAFREEDALFFYGRENFSQTLVEATQRGELVSVIGASGSGKSSVVFAGLVPELKRQGLWKIVSCRPGQRPFQSLSTAWVASRAFHQSQEEQLHSALQLAEEWRTDSAVLHNTVDTAIWESPGTKLLFIVDQFEELYTQCQDTEERQAFIDGLLKVVELTNVALVITLRSDFLGQALAYPPLANVLRQGNRMLGAMSSDELQLAIVQPAALLGVTLEEGLPDRMIAAVSHSNGNLPLLEFALQELWKKRQGTQLTHAAYDEIGGLEAAVARYMEQAYNRLSESEKERSRQIFLQLVRPGEETVDTRRVATRAEIGDENWDLVTRLASERLVVTGQDAIAKTETAELVHEALIYAWRRLQNWIEENRDFRLWQERLRASLRQWESSGRDEGALLRGKPLIDAEDRLLKHPEELAAEQEFITASVRLRENDKERLTRQRRRTVVGLTSGLIGALGLATIAGVGWWFATNAATNERIKTLLLESQSLFELASGDYRLYRDNRDNPFASDSSSTSPEQKKQADQFPKRDKERLKKEDELFQDALLKAVEAAQALKHSIGVAPETRFQVLEMLRRIVASEEKTTTIYLSECDSMKRGHVSFVWTSDRKTVACVNYDGTVRLWDSSTWKKVNIFRGDSEWVDDVAFSPDGKIIASGTVDGTVNLWERSTGKKIRELKGYLSQVRSIIFSPNGQTLAVTNYDGTLNFWEVLTGKKLRTIYADANPNSPKEMRVGFSPDWKFLVSVGNDLALKLWEVETGREITTIQLDRKSLVDDVRLSFTHDSQNIIYTDKDQGKLNPSVKVFNIPGEKYLEDIPVNGEPYFSPDRKMIAVIDGKEVAEHDLSKFKYSFTKSTVSIWDALTGKKIKTFRNFPPGELAKISFSSDNSWIAVYAYDNKGGTTFGPAPGSKASITITKIDGTGTKTVEQYGEVLDIVFSPDHKKVVISSFGRKNHIICKLWDVTTGRELKTFIDEPILFGPGILSVGLGTQFSPDGKMITAVSHSGIAKFFDAVSGAEINLPNVSPSQKLSPITSEKDRGTIITPKTDGSMIFKDSLKGKTIKLNRYDSALVNAAHISADNQKITTVDWRGKLQTRELKTGRILKIRKLYFEKYASSLKFSPDGSKVAGAMSNYLIKVWDVSTGKEITTLKEYISIKDDANDWRRNEVFFNSDASIVAVFRQSDNSVAEEGGELELWQVSTGKPMQLSKEMNKRIKGISFSPSSNILAILKFNNLVYLWDLSSRHLVKEFKPNLGDVERIQFQNDDKSLFIQSNDALKILNTKTSREIASFRVPFGLISSSNFSANGKKLTLEYDNQFTSLNFDLEDLLRRSCKISRNFQKKNQTKSPSDKHICDSVS